MKSNAPLGQWCLLISMTANGAAASSSHRRSGSEGVAKNHALWMWFWYSYNNFLWPYEGCLRYARTFLSWWSQFFFSKLFSNFDFFALLRRSTCIKLLFQKNLYQFVWGFVCASIIHPNIFKDSLFNCFSNQKTSPNILNCWTSPNFF